MSKYNELISNVKEVLDYCKNDNYLEDINEKFSDFKSKYKILFKMIIDKEFDTGIFLNMIVILNKIDNNEITKQKGEMEFGMLLAKKYKIPMNLDDKDLLNISKKYNIPIEDLNEYYSNLKK